MFVEDPAIVLNELAVILPLGTPAHRSHFVCRPVDTQQRRSIRQLGAILRLYGYEVVPVPVLGCLHLKSAVTFLGQNTLLASRAWFEAQQFSRYDWIDVAPEEPHAANALALSNTIIFPSSLPRTRSRIEERGFHVTPIDISELQKAESGLTCSSPLFEGS